MLVRLVLALLVATISAANVPVYAQQTEVETSADDFGGRFFGESLVQIVITDDSADASGVIEDITVNIDADPETGSGGSGSFVIPETSASSGRFEFYLAHVNADDVDSDDIDPINTAGVEGATGAGPTAAPIITFGPAADGAELALEGAEDLYEDVSFEITAGNTEIELSYEETLAELALDRSSYGSDNVVYITLTDNDANLNPTAQDSFVVDPSAGPNNDLLELGGGTITQMVVFEETGDNTAEFEGRYQLGASIDASSESLVLTVNDKANYGATLTADENDSNSIAQASFTVGDTSGSMTVNEGQTPTFDAVISADKDAYSLGETVSITIKDQDANTSPSGIDSVPVNIEALSSGEEEQISATETGSNTGIFVASFKLDADDSPAAIKVHINDNVAISYLDNRPANNAPAREFSTQVSIVAADSETGQKTTASEPVPKDITGRQLSSVALGQQAILSTTIENSVNQDQPFVALVEVRDSDGVTIFLAWQTGTLNAQGNVEVGLSWTPSEAGEYQVRTFVLSDLANPQVLSVVAQSSLNVS